MNTSPAIRENDLPEYRIENTPWSCTSTEALSVLIGGKKAGETASALLARYGGDLAALRSASVRDMTECRGVTKNIAIRIKAALALSIMLGSVPRKKINGASDIAEIVSPEMSILEREHFRVALLDRRNQLIVIEEVYIGSVGEISTIRLSDVFAPAVKRSASAIILIHNHPSGDSSPSPDDVAVTREAIKAGELLGITVLDHIVIGRPACTSLKSQGLGFK